MSGGHRPPQNKTASFRFLTIVGGRLMPLTPRLLALATAVPPILLDQEDVVERVKRLFGRSAILDRLLPVFANSGIRHRYSTVPLDWYDEPHGWKERNGRYIAGALDLLETVAGRHRDAEPRRAADRAHAIAAQCRTAAGLRSGMCRRDHWPGARRRYGSGDAGQSRALARRRIVHPLLPPRRSGQEQYRRDRAVWRRRRRRALALRR